MKYIISGVKPKCHEMLLDVLSKHIPRGNFALLKIIHQIQQPDGIVLDVSDECIEDLRVYVQCLTLHKK